MTGSVNGSEKFDTTTRDRAVGVKRNTFRGKKKLWALEVLEQAKVKMQVSVQEIANMSRKKKAESTAQSNSDSPKDRRDKHGRSSQQNSGRKEGKTQFDPMRRSSRKRRSKSGERITLYESNGGGVKPMR